MKFSKASILITALTFLILAVAVANLVFCITSGEGIVLGIGIAVVMLGIFIACVVTAVKDAKKAAKAALGDDDDDDADDDDDDDDED